MSGGICAPMNRDLGGHAWALAKRQFVFEEYGYLYFDPEMHWQVLFQTLLL